MNQTHRAIINSYLIRIKETKIQPIVNLFLNSFRYDPSMSLDERNRNFTSMMNYSLEKFVEIPKVTSLWEYSFLFQNLYDLAPQGWQSIHFRGEAMKYSTPCQCGYHRQADKNNPIDEIKEVQRFQKSEIGKKITKDFEDSGFDNFEDHHWWWFLTQHYAMEGNYKTRLLDVTLNPYVALYWACENKKHHDKDGRVYIFLDLESTRLSHRPEDRRRKYEDYIPYQTYQDYIYDKQKRFEINRILGMNTEDLENGYILMKRLVAQSGEFILQNEPQGLNFFLDIDGASKEKILGQLMNLINIDERHMLLEAKDT